MTSTLLIRRAGRRCIRVLSLAISVLLRTVILYSQYITVIYKEGNVLFNDALNTFYLWLYGIGHMVKDHSDSVATWATLSD